MPLRCNDIYIYVCLTHSKRLSLTHHSCSMPDTYIKRPCFSLLVASASVPSKQLSKRLFQLGCINISCFSLGVVVFWSLYRQAIRLPTAWEFLQLCPLNSWLDLLYSAPPPRTWWGGDAVFRGQNPSGAYDWTNALSSYICLQIPRADWLRATPITNMRLVHYGYALSVFLPHICDLSIIIILIYWLLCVFIETPRDVNSLSLNLSAAAYNMI